MKKILILTLAALFVFSGCSIKGEATEHFDFTVTEFVDTLADEYFTHLTFIATVPTDDGRKINTYTKGSPDDSIAPMVHYQIAYDEKTEKVDYINFFTDRDFETVLPDLVLTHYFIHTGAVSSVIEPNIDVDVLLDKIAKGFKENDPAFAIYKGEKFELTATYNDKYCDASFRPVENK